MIYAIAMLLASYRIANDSPDLVNSANHERFKTKNTQISSYSYSVLNNLLTDLFIRQTFSPKS